MTQSPGERQECPASEVLQGQWSRNASDGKGKWARRLIGVLLLVAVLVLSAVIALRTEGGWRHAAQRMDELKPLFVGVHLILIALLWWRWEALVGWLLRKRKASRELRDMALSLRGRTVAVLLAIEVLVVLQWPFKWLG